MLCVWQQWQRCEGAWSAQCALTDCLRACCVTHVAMCMQTNRDLTRLVVLGVVGVLLWCVLRVCCGVVAIATCAMLSPHNTKRLLHSFHLTVEAATT